MPATLNHILVDLATARPSNIAYRYLRDGTGAEDVVSYGALEAASRSIGALLQEKVAPGSRVLLLFPPGLDFIKCLFACLRAGMIAVPLPWPDKSRNGERALARLQHIAGDCGATAILTDGDLAIGHQDGVRHCHELAALTWVDPKSASGDIADAFHQADTRGDSVALVQYTSGSTAMPKGVVLTHENILANQRLLASSMLTKPGDIGCGWLPLHHDMGLIGLVLHSLYGGIETVLMSPLHFLQEPFRWLRAISRYRATISGAPSFAYELCVRRMRRQRHGGNALADIDLGSWAIAFNGAEPIRADVLNDFADVFAPYGFRRNALFPCYGLAEATLFVAGAGRLQGPTLGCFEREDLEHSKAVPAHAGSKSGRHLVSSGYVPDPSTGTGILIVDPETTLPSIDGHIGEVWVRGPSVAMRYWRGDDELQGSLAATTAEGQCGFLRTGDLGFIRNGQLFITGRLKEVMIVHGRNIYPQDIEHVAQASHPKLRSGGGAAFGMLHDEGERLILIQEVAGENQTELDEVIRTIRVAVARELAIQLSAIALVSAKTIPKTPSGKTRRREIASTYAASRLEILREWRDCPHWADVEARTTERSLCEPSDDLARPPREGVALIEDGQRRDVESVVARIWRRTLGIDEIGSRDSFFEIGGDSVRAVEILFEVRRTFGVDIDAPTLFEEFTVENLVSLIDAQLLDRVERFGRGEWEDVSRHGKPLAHLRKSENVPREPIVSSCARGRPSPSNGASAHELDARRAALPLEACAPVRGDAAADDEIDMVSPRVPTGPAPLSSSQEDLWAHTTMFRGMYAEIGWRNLWISLLLRGSLDRVALRRAIEEVVRRHEILRTRFPLVAGVLSVDVSPASDVPIDEVDLTSLPEPQRLAEVARMTGAGGAIALDLHSGPLLSFKLLRLEREAHVIVGLVDHMVFDGWSFGSLVRELNAIYAALTARRQAELEALPFQYGSYALWERKYLSGAAIDSARKYWHSQLAGPIRALLLPADRRRTLVQPFSLGRQTFTLSAETSARAADFSRQNGLSLFATLLAAFKALLWRYTRQDDVAVASAMSNRQRPELQSLVGPFSNVVILRTALDGDPSFAGLAARVRRVIAGALAHQDFPLGQVYRELFPRSRPFRTSFTFQNYPAPELDLPGIRVTPLDVNYGSGLWELNVVLAPSADSIAGVVTYNAELFEAPSITRILRHYACLLEASLREPSRQISQLSLPEGE